MRFVAVDIGNSKTRLGLFQDAALQTAYSILTDKHSNRGPVVVNIVMYFKKTSLTYPYLWPVWYQP
ncbi:MAG: hypothetical protein R3A45_06380 [Bdellovibrionota bacterium]